MNPTLCFFSYLFDRIIGEYPKLTHPVIMIGWLISFFGRHFYHDSVKRGAFLVVFIMIVVMSFSFVISQTPIMIQIFFATWLLASNSLYSSVKDILENPQNIKYLVSRDTKNLSKSEVYKAGIETYGENLSDGVIAPLFYLCLFGINGIFFYKAINTLDSMVGYRTKRYERLGKFSAKLDDVLNYIPARITAIMILLLSGNVKKLKQLSQAKGHKSPNAGYPITAIAIAVGVKLGGDTSYFGKVVKKPYFGEGRVQVTKEDLKRALKLQFRFDLFIMIGLFCMLIFK